jgi:hypothetical protein
MAGGRRENSGRTAHKAKAQYCQRLDVRYWTRVGLLAAPCNATLTFRDRESGETRGWIEFTFDGQALVTLEYAIKSGEMRQEVEVVKTSCNLGGARAWVLCPLCSKRVAVLFLGRPGFGCRSCNNVAYQSQSADYISRMWLRQAKIEAVLTEQLVRPKGMHKSTFERLRRRAVQLLIDRHDAVDAEMSRRGWTPDA